MSSASIFTCFY